MTKKTKFALAGVATAAVLGIAAWLAFLYPVWEAEGTELGGFGRYDFRPVAFDIKDASGSEVPNLEVNCSDEKYSTGGWREKWRASRSLNYWARKARRAQDAFVKYDDAGSFKLAEVAASDTIEYWTTVKYLKKEMECYDLASLNKEKPY